MVGDEDHAPLLDRRRRLRRDRLHAVPELDWVVFRLKLIADPATPDEYIESLEEPRRSEIAELDSLIREHAPELEPHVDRSMLGYGTYHYRYASGHEGDAAVIGLSSRARYISLYANVGVAEKYRAELPTADIGKSCIRFKRLDDVDRAVLAKVIEETADAGKAC